jgi:dTDP-glucose 4,6-dehydratase
LLSNQKVPLYGTGENIREWIHVDDHVQGIDLVDKNGMPGEVYNLGSGEHLTNHQIAEFLLSSMSVTHDMIEFVEDRKGHDFRYSLDISKAKELLNFQPMVNFEQGLTETINWYRNNQDFLMA